MSLTAADINELSSQYDARNAKFFTAEQQQQVQEQQFISLFIKAIIDNARLTRRI